MHSMTRDARRVRRIRAARRMAALSAIAALSIGTAATAQDTSALAQRYTKTEYRIPMRDGVHLFTVVYAPRQNARRYPILMTRTPYGVGPYGSNAYPGSLGPSPRFADEGFIFVYQDVRGRFMSEGTFVNMTPWIGTSGARHTDESTDTYDTIAWLLKHIRNNNGRVGMWGTSYPGFFAAAGLVDAHPALKAVSPQAPQADWFMGDDVHHHGAFFLTSAFNFFITAGRARPAPTTQWPPRFNFGTDDGYAFFLAMGPLSNADKLYLKGVAPFWNDMMTHDTYDAFWQARRIAPHLRHVTPAVLTVGGWYDANNLHGALLVHASIAAQSPATSNRIVVGPWSHGQWARGPGDSVGQLAFGVNTGPFFRDSVEFPFFQHYLEGTGTLALAPATMFETGTNRWRTFDAWPPHTTTRSLYLEAGGRLSFVAPTDSGPAGAAPYDQYVSDPAHPVPFLERPNTGMKPDYMAYDQRFASNRPDVLVYTSQPLAKDVTVAGSIHPVLFVSTSGTDSDWIVKLIDVAPDSGTQEPAADAAAAGFEELVRGDVMRGKFRTSYARPQPFVPGRVTKVAFGMDDVLHTFRTGHRIMVQIQSTWFPLVDRSPQRFEQIYRAAASDFQPATERVYRSASAATRVELPVLP